jgi:hypothetical protein
LTPAIGTEIKGLDLRQLTDGQKDELYAASRFASLYENSDLLWFLSALLVGERGVVCTSFLFPSIFFGKTDYVAISFP